MLDTRQAALNAARRIRSSTGYQNLSGKERRTLEQDLAHLERALGGMSSTLSDDPFAVPTETPLDLAGPRAGPSPARTERISQRAAEPTRAQPAQPGATETIGERSDRALDAVDFPSFVAGLIDGTFQAIVDSTTQQVRQYADLVASLQNSVRQFSSENVSANQARDWLLERYPQDLTLVLPKTGESGTPRILPIRDDGRSPDWLEQYGLEGEELTAELTEGPLLRSARLALAEERMQHLATLVLMGISRIVIDDGRISARLHFSARAREKVTAEIATGGQQIGIAQRGQASRASVSTTVSTVGINAQADSNIKANLVGEVSIRFRTETFDLDNFAGGEALQLITGHSRMVRPPAHRESSTAPAPKPDRADEGGGE